MVQGAITAPREIPTRSRRALRIHSVTAHPSRGERRQPRRFQRLLSVGCVRERPARSLSEARSIRAAIQKRQPFFAVEPSDLGPWKGGECRATQDFREDGGVLSCSGNLAKRGATVRIGPMTKQQETQEPSRKSEYYEADPDPGLCLRPE